MLANILILSFAFGPLAIRKVVGVPPSAEESRSTIVYVKYKSDYYIVDHLLHDILTNSEEPILSKIRLMPMCQNLEYQRLLRHIGIQKQRQKGRVDELTGENKRSDAGHFIRISMKRYIF